MDDNEKVSAIPEAENKGEIAYNQGIIKLTNLKQAALKENISVQELQKIKEKIFQVIQETKDANSQQQIANDIFTGLTELDDNEKVQAISGAQNKGEIAYSQAITKLADLKREASKENISVQELQKIKEKILQVIQDAKNANAQQEIANDIATGLTFEELPQNVKDYYKSKGVTATTTALENFVDATLPDGFTIPNSITTIKFGAFFNVKTLPDSFTIPSSVTTIKGGAFFGVKHFPIGFVIPSSVTTIKGGVFQETILPVGFLVPSSVTLIENAAFDAAKLPDGTLIQDPPFYPKNGLTLNSDGTWSS